MSQSVKTLLVHARVTVRMKVALARLAGRRGKSESAIIREAIGAYIITTAPIKRRKGGHRGPSHLLVKSLGMKYRKLPRIKV
jgi:hypothetical protein